MNLATGLDRGNSNRSKQRWYSGTPGVSNWVGDGAAYRGLGGIKSGLREGLPGFCFHMLSLRCSADISMETLLNKTMERELRERLGWGPGPSLEKGHHLGAKEGGEASRRVRSVQWDRMRTAGGAEAKGTVFPGGRVTKWVQ